MKLRNYKFIKYLIMPFFFMMVIFLVGENKVDAASTDLYFETKMLSNGYDENGKSLIIDELNVYAHNNGAGRQINENHTLRLYSVTIEVGSESKTFILPDDNKDNKYVGEITNGHSYGSLKASEVDKIPLKIGAMLSELNNNQFNNNVYISLKFQQRGKITFFYTGWSDYKTTVNYYKDSQLYAGKVHYNVTTSTTLEKSIKDASTSISLYNDTNCKNSDNNCFYNIADLNSNKPLNLTVTNSFPFTGRVLVKVQSEPYTYVSNIYLEFQNSNVAEVNLANYLPLSNKEITYTITELVVNSSRDKYGTNTTSNYTYTMESNINLDIIVDTISPVIESAGVTTTEELGNVFYDVADIPVAFKTSEEKEYSFAIETLYFKIGTNIVSVNCDCTLAQVNENSSDTLTTTIQLSGNGKVELIGFTGVLLDKYGNVKEYEVDSDNSTTGVQFDNEEIELVSSVNDVTSNKVYYYNGDTVDIEVSMKTSQTYDKMSLSITSYNGEVTKQDYFTGVYEGNNLTISYNVGNQGSGTYISKIELYKQDPVTEEYILVYTKDLQIYLNTYFDLVVSPVGEVVNEKIVITNPIANTVYLHNESIDVFKAYYSSSDDMYCYKDGNGIPVCEYNPEASDGSLTLTIAQGNITLATGQKNNEKTFDVVINIKIPVVENIILSNNIIFSEGKYYYKNYTSAITFDVKDGNYDGELCLHYTFDDNLEKEEYTKLCSDTLTMDLPSLVGEYTLRYYVSDGINQSDVKVYDTKFVYRNSFELGDLEIKVNGIVVNQLNNDKISDNKYNYITLEYKNAEHLLDRFDIMVGVPEAITGSSNLSSNTFNVSKSQLGTISDVVTVAITLTDKLGNRYIKNVRVDIDTIAPVFDNITVNNVTNNDDTYTVYITGYEDNDVKVILDGIETDVDSSYSFNTKLTKYTMVLIDGAGNRSEKVFTTTSPLLEFNVLSSGAYDVRYELYINPFDSSVHVVEDYKYLVFDYTTDEISSSDIEVARNNVCTAGRTIKCYKVGTYIASNFTINQTFTRGYTYIVQVKVNNVLLNEVGTNTLPRLDISDPDTTTPSWGYLDEDTNPDYISSVSGEKFEFKFLASDVNLSNSFYYLVVDKSQVSSMTVENFYNLHKTCYGATIDTNGCGVYGEVEYNEEVEEDVYLGNVIIEANYNTKRRLKNNEQYSLYVLLSDESGNVELFKVRDFINVTSAPNVEYLNDDEVYVSISNGESASTNNTSAIRISKYHEKIDVKEVIIDGNPIECSASGCLYTLGIGKYKIEVKDVLGNITNVDIYSATASNPVVDVYYEYYGEYFKIIDNSFAYNTSNASKVYLKVSGSDIHTIKVTMNATNSYVTGDELFESLTDMNNQYGVSLLEVMEIVNQHNGSEYSGNITISAINSSEGETSITLLVDNETPQITVVPMDSKLDLLGDNPATLRFDIVTKEYSIEFDYQRDVTYAYLMNVLSLKVDGIAFNEIIENNRFKLRVDANVFTSYDESITKGTRKITVDYFDNAGNEAETFTINVTCQDSQKPILSLSAVASTVEVNKVTTLAQVLMSDNHDSNEELELKVTIGGTEINHTSYKFVSPGEYTIVYTLTDTSSNSSTITQIIIAKDTIAPELIEGTQKRYEVGIGEKLEFGLPKFVDSDASASIYEPYQIIVYDPTGAIMDSSKANYSLSVEEDVVKIIFANDSRLGTYNIKFIAKDDAGNVGEEVFEIVVKDSGSPEIEVSVNGINVDDEGMIALPLGSEVNLNYIAYDEYDGDISSSVVVTVTYNGNFVSGVDPTKSGDYIVVFTVKDSADNSASSSITIKIKKDEILPVINQVIVNNVVLLEGVENKINGNSLKIDVDASDDSNNVSIEIIINNNYSLGNGEAIAIEQGVYDVVYTIKVVVKDTSDNEVSKIYTLIVDNKLPVINGVNAGEIYLNQIQVSVVDENIELVEIYVNDILSTTFNSNLGNYTLSNKGLYRIVAKDAYGNVSSTSFVLLDEKKFNIMSSDNTAKLYDYDIASLIEVTLDNDTVIFHLQENTLISTYDNVYLLVKYPNSNYKYVAYQMNGETYLINDSVSIKGSIIEGVENSKLLEKMGDKYYAYVMVVKSNNVGNSANPENKDNSVAKGIVTAILAILGVVLVLILFIKLRRRVRAI